MKRRMTYTARIYVTWDGKLNVNWVQGHYAPKRRFLVDGTEIEAEIRTCPEGIRKEISDLLRAGQETINLTKKVKK